MRMMAMSLAAILLLSGVACADVRDDQAAAKLTALGARLRLDKAGRIASIALWPGESKVTDADLGCIDGLPGVISVVLVEMHLTDDALAHLATLPALERLYLGGTHTDVEHVTRVGGKKLTDRGLAHLAKIKTLRNLTLAAPGLTDAGLGHIEGMADLRSLGLSSPGFTDAGVVRLLRLSALQELNVTDSRIGTRRLAALDGLPRLRSLVLGPNTYDADDLRPLADFAALRRLMFYKSKFAGDALKEIERLTELETLDLTETPITASQLASLTKALPTTGISVQDGQPMSVSAPIKK